jgi:hypothetical protein
MLGAKHGARIGHDSTGATQERPWSLLYAVFPHLAGCVSSR